MTRRLRIADLIGHQVTIPDLGDVTVLDGFYHARPNSPATRGDYQAEPGWYLRVLTDDGVRVIPVGLTLPVPID